MRTQQLYGKTTCESAEDYPIEGKSTEDAKSVWATFSLVALVLLAVMAVACGFSRWRLVSMDSHTHALKFSSLFFTDSDHGLAITAAQVLETSDGGKTWVEKFPSGDKTFQSMQFVSQSMGFIAGVQGNAKSEKALVLRTDDSGKSWHEIALDLPEADSDPSLYSISFCNSQIGWAVGTDFVLRTTDSGQSWEVQHANDGKGFLDVSCVSAEQAWIVGMDGLILQTTNGGTNWSRVTSGTNANLARVKTFGNEGWIVGGILETGVLLRTRDRGASWESIDLNATAPLLDIYLNGKQGWIVGVGGTIFETSDSGETWTQRSSPTSDNLHCLFFLSSNRGWAGGAHKTLLSLSE